MNITVVGTGCFKCKKLEEIVKEVVAEKGIEASVNKMTDVMEISKTGILMTPGLMIDGVVRLSGKLPSKKEVEKIIESAK